MLHHQWRHSTSQSTYVSTFLQGACILISLLDQGEQLHLNKLYRLPHAGATRYGLYHCTPCHALSHVIAEVQGKGTHQCPIIIHSDNDLEESLNGSDWTPAEEEVAAQYDTKKPMTTKTSALVPLENFPIFPIDIFSPRFG